MCSTTAAAAAAAFVQPQELTHLDPLSGALAHPHKLRAPNQFGQASLASGSGLALSSRHRHTHTMTIYNNITDDLHSFWAHGKVNLALNANAVGTRREMGPIILIVYVYVCECICEQTEDQGTGTCTDKPLWLGPLARVGPILPGGGSPAHEENTGSEREREIWRREDEIYIFFLHAAPLPSRRFVARFPLVLSRQLRSCRLRCGDRSTAQAQEMKTQRGSEECCCATTEHAPPPPRQCI